jgi:hypothetical protein
VCLGPGACLGPTDKARYQPISSLHCDSIARMVVCSHGVDYTFSQVGVLTAGSWGWMANGWRDAVDFEPRPMPCHATHGSAGGDKKLHCQSGMHGARC